LEFQQRGAPHLHVLDDAPWPGTKDAIGQWRDDLAQAWFRIVGSGDEKHLKAGTSSEKVRSPRGGSFYAVKYASKMYQKLVPPGYQNCGRFWGSSRGVTPVPTMSIDCDEQSLRAILGDWRYCPDEGFPMYKVLYNATEVLAQIAGDVLDLPR
jgi:hypothetical protein